MLSNIRQLINQKKAFQEAASIIFEDGMGNLDDQIVLGEENDKPVPDPEDTEPTIPEENENDGGDEGDSEDNSPEEVPTNPEPTEPLPTEDPVSEPESDGAPMPLPTDDGELPTPVGKQTGEPIEDPDDLLDVSIDLKSNTIRDVLPVPPANAAEALGGDEGDDIMNARIDSGFGGDSTPSTPEPTEPVVDTNPAQPGPVPTEPTAQESDDHLEERGFGPRFHEVEKKLQGDDPDGVNKGQKKEEGYKQIKPKGGITPEEAKAFWDKMFGGKAEGEEFKEAITLGNDLPEGDNTADVPPADAGNAGGDTTPDAGSEPPADESPVTAAVKDKVDEITSDSSDDETSSKDDLLKKLGNITKSLEDAKKAIMNTLQ